MTHYQNSKRDARAATVDIIKHHVSKVLEVPLDTLNTARPLTEYGLDSILVVRLVNALAVDFTSVTSPLIFEHKTVQALAEHFAAQAGAQDSESRAVASLAPVSDTRDAAAVEPSGAGFYLRKSSLEPASGQGRATLSAVTANGAARDIAVVGLAGRYPGAATLRQFWTNLSQGISSISEVPSYRWDWRDYHGDNKGGHEKIYTRWAGFIDDADKFDPLFFRLSPKDALFIDPQERVFLETAYHAIEDAGYSPQGLARECRVGVFVGVMNNTYGTLTSYWSIPNRTSFCFDFTGPSMAIDTACSSSLTALHTALESLGAGSCDCALVGGVNIIARPVHMQGLCAMTMLSSGPSCRSFGSDADGTVAGEGVGAVLIRPLRDALAAGDHVYAVIKSSSANSGGRTQGFTVPDPGAQHKLVRAALERGGIDPRSISYVEAHGTGTALGDPIEIAGLAAAWRQGPEPQHGARYCAIGSVKSNIGHLESAAGIAGLTKVLLQLRHRQLVPSLNAEAPNPDIDFEATPFRLQSRLDYWESAQQPRRAAVSSFGAGGANAHVIVEEFIDPRLPRAPQEVAGPLAFVFSARTESQLKQLAGAYADWLGGPEADSVPLSDLAFTLQGGRQAMKCRFAVLARDRAELIDQLAAYAADKPTAAGLAWSSQQGGHEQAAMLNEIEDMQAIAQAWVGQGKLKQVLDLWVKGFDLDWTEAAGRGRRVVQLPRYPFQRNSYWVAPEQRFGAAAPARRDAAGGREFTLSAGKRAMRLETRIRADDVLVAEHQVGKARMMPGVGQAALVLAGLEFLFDAVSRGEMLARLSGVVWARPLTIAPEGSDVALLFSFVTEHQLGFQLIEAGSTGHDALVSQGQVHLFAATDAPQVDAGALATRCGAPLLDPEQLYRGYSEAGIAYGPAYRVIRSLGGGAGEVLAALRLAQGAAVGSRTAQVTLLDGALQATALLSAGHLDGLLALPFSLDGMVVYDALPADCLAWIRPTLVAPAGEGPPKLDVDVLARDGRVLARLEGFAVRPVPAAPAATGRTEVLAFGWEPVLDRELPLLHAATPGAGTLVAFSAAIPAVLRARLEAQFPGIGLHAHADADTLPPLLDAGRHCERLILVLDPESHPLEGDALISAQRAGIGLCFRLVKALLARKPAKMALTVVTTQAVAVNDSDGITAVHAGVHGLMGSAAKEFPHWSINTLDVPTGPEREDALLEAIRMGPVGGQGLLASRRGQWYREQVRACEAFDSGTDLYRHKGVYVVIGGAGGLSGVWTELMIRNYQAQVVWIGRSAQDEAIGARLDRLGALGPRPLYLSADATSLAALQEAKAQVLARFGVIHGVVHAAIVLRDAGLASMGEADLDACLAAKIDTSVRMAQAFGSLALDFMLFFSSMQSITRSAGQGNYAAGCTFEDAFVRQLQAGVPYPVKVVNWGYWGSTGIVATEAYRTRMTLAGVASIEAEEGMHALGQLMRGRVGRLGVMKFVDRKPGELGVAEQLSELPQCAPLLDAAAIGRAAGEAIGASDLARLDLNPEADAEETLAQRLWLKLDEIGLTQWPAQAFGNYFDAWLATSWDFIEQFGVARRSGARLVLAAPLDSAAVMRNWEAFYTTHAGYADHQRLVDQVFTDLEAIIQRRKLATDILFPNSSMDALKSVYKGNHKSDLYNRVLTGVAAAYVEHRLATGVQEPLRILEIGAGTGGTSDGLLACLGRYGHHIAEYNYTDISKAFLLHAKQTYGPRYPFLKSQLLNIEKPLEAQGVAAGSYDIVVATNVLHATADMHAVMANCKLALRRGGIVLINEIAERSLFTHVTFGLLEGWWLSQDKGLRMPGHPGLTSRNWQWLLEHEGFHPCLFPAESVHRYGQQIIVAQSDGLVRQRETELVASRRPAQPPRSLAAGGPQVSPVRLTQPSPASPTLAQVEALVIAKLAAALQLDEDEVGSGQHFVDFGIDSITGVQLVNQLNEALGVNMDTTSLFSHTTPAALARHIVTQQAPRLPAAPARASDPARAYTTLPAGPVPAGAADSLEEAVGACIVTVLSEALQLAEHEIPANEQFTDFGVDSITGVRIVERLNAELGIALETTVLFSYSTVEKLAVHICAAHGPRLELQAAGPQAPVREQAMPPSEPMYTPSLPSHVEAESLPSSAQPVAQGGIAIIGMSGRFAGSDYLEQLWQHLKAGDDLVAPVARWDLARFDAGFADRSKGYSNCGSFIDGIDQFDPQFFSISGAEAEYMDPQHRLFMQECWHALEDAGHAGDTVVSSRTGLYVGCGGSDYIHYFDSKPPAQAFWGNSNAVLASRIAYCLDLRGPAVAVDTACSSSLVAVHLACQALHSGEIDLALAGGIMLNTTPNFYLTSGRARMLSASGRCHTFDQAADGFVPGEGVGVVMLRRLDRALAERDNIHGVIVASALNQDGASNGITAPNALAQTRLVEELYQRCGIDVDRIGMVEAHGTGTVLGDPIEFGALTSAFRKFTNARQFCAIGSIKTNIGHAGAAAGVAGMFRALLALHHEAIPASLHFERANAAIDMGGSPFYVNTGPVAWPASERPRCAAVSSFGFSGTNAHLVIQEAPRLSSARRPHGAYLVVLSAQSRGQLAELVSALDAQLSSGHDDIADVSYTLAGGRRNLNHRLAVVAGGRDELRSLLADWLAGRDSADFRYGELGRKKTAEDAAVAATGARQIADYAAGYMPPGQDRDILRALAALFCQGYALAWDRLMGDSGSRRISLPGYPFSRQSFWVGSEDTLVARLAEKPQENRPASAVLHPLLHENRSNLAECAFVTRLDTGAPFLRDHVIDGSAVLPGVAQLEMARAALDAVGEGGLGAGMRLSRVVWMRPGVAPEGRLDLRIVLERRGQEVAWEIVGLDGATVLSRGMGAAPGDGPGPVLDLGRLRRECGQAGPSRQDVYQSFARAGMEYGPSLQAIEALWYGSDAAATRQVLARLRVPPGTPDDDRLVLHPAVMDAALQALIGFSLLHEGEAEGPCIPYAAEEVCVFAGCPAQAWALLRRADATGRRFDIDLCGNDGTVCVAMRGVTVRPLSGREPAPGPSGLEGACYLPRWEDAMLPATQPALVQDRHVLVLASGYTAAQGAALQAALPAARTILLEQQLEEPAGRYTAQAAQLLGLLQDVLGAGGPCRVQLLTRTVEGEPEQLFAGLAALLKTAQLENPRLSCQVLQLGTDLDGPALSAVVAREAGQELDSDVRYRDGVRQVRRICPLAARGDAGGARPLPEDGVYLVTGGMGKLGQLIARSIARRCAGARIVLTGRAEPATVRNEEILAAPESRGRISYHQLDLGDIRAIEALVAQLKQEHGRVDVVIHAAGTRRDRLLRDKTAADIEAVLMPKVQGLVNLDRATRSEALSHFVLFSSISALAGNPGQADYACANGFMDEYARYRNALAGEGRRAGRTVSINWTLWAEGGMGTEPEVLAQLTRSGLAPLASAHGEALFHAITTSAIDAAQWIVMVGTGAQQGRPDCSVTPVPSPRTAAPATDDLLAVVQNSLMEHVASALKLPLNDVDLYTELNEFGFDSLLLADFAQELNRRYDIEIMPTLFFEHPTLAALAAHLTVTCGPRIAATLASAAPPASVATAIRPTAVPAEPAASKEDTAAPGPLQRRIAVIGMSGRFPGAADVSAFWDRLEEGADCIAEIPPERWDWRRHWGDPALEANKTSIKWMGFIDGVAEFDPLYFGISPTEAVFMDPQQRLLMTHCIWAIEDAGYAPGSLAGSDTGVFVGTSISGYSQLIESSGANIEGYSAAGITASVGPNRVSYFLNLHGPSEPVETACSSSLVALHKAMFAIRLGHCRMALAGGVNTILTPDLHISFDKAGMLARDGRCKTFSRHADGYVRGEGVGVLLLKGLEQAERDGDAIYGVLLGGAVNHGGKANSLTAPNPKAQAQVVRAAIADAGVDPRSIGYIEAHGTGTGLGDPVEINGLKAAFELACRDQDIAPGQAPHCAVGSVKSNIGHLELAAGIAGVIKVLLQFRHRCVVPSLHCAEINPYIELAGSPLYIARHKEAWPRIRDDQGVAMPRSAGVSSFGFGGVNAHVLLQEYPERRAAGGGGSGPYPIVISARTATQLRDSAARLHRELEREAWVELDLADIAYTLQVGRDPWEERLLLFVDSLADLRATLAAYLADETPTAKLYRGRVANKAPQHAGTDQVEAAFARLRHGDVEPLAALWLTVRRLDWLPLYAGQEGSRRRLHLPGYPFASDRYWVEPAPPVAASSTAAGNAGGHPWLQMNASTFREIRFGTDLRVPSGLTQGKFEAGATPPAPMALLAFVAAAINAACGGTESALAFTDVRFAATLPFAEPLLHVGLQHGGDLVRFEVYQATDHSGGGSGPVFAQGSALPTVLPASAPDVMALRQEMSRSLSHSELSYGFHSALGTAASAARIAMVCYDEEEAVVEFTADGACAAMEDPACLVHAADDLFGVAGALLGGGVDVGMAAAVLPHRIDKTILAAGPRAARHGRVKLREAARNRGEQMFFDAWLLDHDGALLCHFEGVAASLVTSASRPVAADGEENLLAFLSRLLAGHLNLDSDAIDSERELEHYGLDSVMAKRVQHTLSQYFPGVKASLLLEHTTLASIAAHLEAEHGEGVARIRVGDRAARALPAPALLASVRGAPTAPATPEERSEGFVAIVGMAGMFPGSRTIGEFWDKVRAEAPMLRDYPVERRELLSTHGIVEQAHHFRGYLDGIELFDHELFKMPFDEACNTDPQLRKLLEVVWSAIQDAGYTLASFRERQTGVFVATKGHSGYHESNPAARLHRPEMLSAYANRLSNIFNLAGPSEAIETGCSGFLVAVKHAMEAIARGRCKQAIVATAELSLSRSELDMADSLGMYSKQRATRSFARDSDGYVRSEAIGAIVIKPLELAREDGDQNYLTVRGVGVCHGGKAPLRWYSPNIKGQKMAIAEALELARVDPATIAYIEPEANGSQLGDVSEMIAIQGVYGPYLQAAGAARTVAIGSLKPLVGHAEVASTFTVLVRLTDAMARGELPGVRDLGPLNDGIVLQPGFEILAAPRPWERLTVDGAALPYRAAIHSLAAGGVNAHMIVEEDSSTPCMPVQRAYLFLFSEYSRDALRDYVVDCMAYLNRLISTRCVVDLAAVEHVLRSGREQRAERLAVIAHSAVELVDKLSMWLRNPVRGSDVLTGPGTTPAPVLDQSRVAALQAARDWSSLGSAWAAGATIRWPSRPNDRRIHMPTNRLKDNICWYTSPALPDPNDALQALLPEVP